MNTGDRKGGREIERMTDKEEDGDGKREKENERDRQNGQVHGRYEACV